MKELRERIHWKLIERYGALVPNAAERLKFVRLSVRVFGQEDPFLRPGGWWWKLRSRAVALEALRLSSRRAVRALGFGDLLLLCLYCNRKSFPKSVGAGAVCLLLVLIPGAASHEGRGAGRRRTPGMTPRPPAGRAVAAAVVEKAPPAPADVWLVESSGASELYSNGLRILNDFATHTGPRIYPVFAVGDGADLEAVEWRHEPAGIVYHTTESEVTSLEPANRDRIRRRDQGLLDYVRRQKLYNFVIDRFGRVYRIVPETEFAHHAGHSVWVSGGEAYLNLNQSFIGVAFEAQTDQANPAEGRATAVQVYSARLLTEMLRRRSGVAEANCVSHDLVSVNPDRMLIGYHTDWAGGFPYEELGLSNKYTEEIPSIVKFGFGYDAAFVEALGGRLWPGIRLSEARIERQAALQGLSVETYRRRLQQRYKRWFVPLPGAARRRRP